MRHVATPTGLACRRLLDGWIILRFTWATFVEHPHAIVEQMRAALRLAARVPD